MLDNYW